jgi:SagB-type dehydrogenase family enzyme
MRAVNPLLVEWVDGEAVVHSPRCSGRYRVGRPVVELLARAATPEGVDIDDLVRDLAETDSLTAIIPRLGEAGLLEAVDTAGRTEQPTLPSPWDAWGSITWSFHESARNAPFVDRTHPDSQRQFDSMTPQAPAPARTTKYTTQPALLLPRVQAQMGPSFRDVLESRRTHRHFLSRPAAVEQFAELLRYSFGPLRFADAGPMGVLELRAGASGGARHETEAYVAILNVADVAPGLYWYDSLRHGLVAIETQPVDVLRQKLETLTYGQGFFVNSAAGVIMTASARHMAWKYRHARAYRVMLQDVGHTAQVFSMTAHALGLGTAMTGAFDDQRADDWLRLEESDEFSTFVLACGHPDAASGGMPKCIQPARSPWQP